MFLEHQQNVIKLWDVSSSTPKRIPTVSRMEQTRLDYTVPPCFYIRSPERTISVLRDLLLVDGGVGNKAQAEFHSRYSLSYIQHTQAEAAKWKGLHAQLVAAAAASLGE
jgi:hypothetical protein